MRKFILLYEVPVGLKFVPVLFCEIGILNTWYTAICWHHVHSSIIAYQVPGRYLYLYQVVGSFLCHRYFRAYENMYKVWLDCTYDMITYAGEFFGARLVGCGTCDQAEEALLIMLSGYSSVLGVRIPSGALLDFYPSHLIFSPFLSFPTIVVTQIWGNMAGAPPSSLLRFVPRFLSRADISPFFPRRLAPNCAYPR